VGKDGSLLDEGETKPITDGDSVKGIDTIQTDWRLPLLECIRDPGKTIDKKVKQHMLKYTSLDDDHYRGTIDGVLLKCLGEEQANVAVWEVHDGICGAHQSANKMNWLLWKAGFYWATMMNDCMKYQKGCEMSQRFENIQLAPAGVMNSIVKLSPFRGWGLDFIGEIHSESSKGHRFILVDTDYFTKWTNAVSLRNMTHWAVISFVQEHIIYQFGVPQTVTTDQGPSFMSNQFREFAESMKIKLWNTSPYYAQVNGQAKTSNKVLIKIIKKRIKDNSRSWHEKLSEVLWAHRISRHGATKVTPFELVYGQEVMLPVEIGLQSSRITEQGSLSAKEYHELMMDKINDIHKSQFKALEEIEKEKIKIAKAYNKRVVEKSFQVGDLVWKTILPLGTRSGKFGKWSPRWEGPFRVIRVVPGNAYFVEDLEGYSLSKALNGKYLKHYCPRMWQDR
jgi:hypothetical protein